MEGGAYNTLQPSSVYEQLLRLTLSGMLLDDSEFSKVMHVIFNSDSFAVKKQQTTFTSQEIATLKDLRAYTKVFLEKQKRGVSALRIQSAVRGFLARKHLNASVKRNKEKIEVIRDTFTREVEYNKILTNLAQHFCVPLLNTPDNKLKEESKDLRELLGSIVDLEVLHRGLLRKFKWFLEEGCSWPNVDGFGNLFLDMSDGFKTYGTFINNFKYTIDILDTGLPSRPRLQAYFNEKDQGGFGFKALLTKPLNQMTHYECAFQSMAEETPSEDPDFKCIMNALSIMNESNKYINACLISSTNVAKVRQFEQKLVFDRKHPELEKFYKEHIPKAQLKDNNIKIELKIKRGVSKKTYSGQATLFDNMIIITLLNKKGNLKIIKTYLMKAVKYEVVNSIHVVLTATNVVEDPSQTAVEIPNTSISLKFESNKLAQDFYDKVHKLKQDTNKNRVFGVDIHRLLEKEQNSTGVPFVVQNLCKYMEEYYLETVGIFRVPGSAQVEKLLKVEYDKHGGNDVDLKALSVSANDAAGMLKLYFRELPTALCGELFTDLVKIQKDKEKNKNSNDNQMISEIIPSVRKLNNNCLNTLAYTCRFMRRVADFKDINKMDCSNVAMCIGPDLLRPSIDSLELALMVPHANEVLGKMVQHYDAIFGDILPREHGSIAVDASNDPGSYYEPNSNEFNNSNNIAYNNTSYDNNNYGGYEQSSEYYENSEYAGEYEYNEYGNEYQYNEHNYEGEYQEEGYYEENENYNYNN